MPITIAGGGGRRRRSTITNTVGTLLLRRRRQRVVHARSSARVISRAPPPSWWWSIVDKTTIEADLVLRGVFPSESLTFFVVVFPNRPCPISDENYVRHRDRVRRTCPPLSSHTPSWWIPGE